MTYRRAHFIIEKGGKLLEAKVGVKPAEDADNAYVQPLPQSLLVPY